MSRGQEEHDTRNRAGIEKVLSHPRVAGEFLVKYKPGSTEGQKTAVHGIVGAELKRIVTARRGDPDSELHLIRLPNGADEGDSLKKIQAHADVLYAQPNYIYRKLDTIPNDPSFGQLWGLKNTGQSGGTPGADISAAAAWDLTTGSPSVVVAVLDTGVDFSHPDLAGSQWINPGEPTANGVDNDGNGRIDDFNGWDFVDNDNTPMDLNGHGTHVSGTIGGRGNNGVGVAGVSWNVRIMALRFLDASGSGTTANAVAAYSYATDLKLNHGINLVAINNSWGGGGFDASLFNAIQAAGNAGILSLCAAGNEGNNNDSNPSYPASYNLNCIVSVAASDRNDRMASFSNFGYNSVHVAAPGVAIYSTIPTGITSGIGVTGYDIYSGTSMATPHVTGTVALIKSAVPGASMAEVRARLLYNADVRDGFAGRVSTCGRINALRSILDTDSSPPGDVTTLTASDPSFSAVQLTWTTVGDDGSLGRAAAYDLRYSTSVITSGNFASATRAVCPPVPLDAGTVQTLRICGLSSSTTYYFALKTIDNIGNVSGLSNVVSATTLAVSTATVVFSDDFEGTGSALNAAKWSSTATWGRANSGTSKRAADSTGGNYANNANSSLTSIDLYLGGRRDTVLTFQHQYAFEYGYDFGYLEVSTDGGASWNWLGQFTGTLSGFTAVPRICLSGYDGFSTVRLRFHLTSDVSVRADGWWIDDVVVLSETVNQPPVANAQSVTTPEDTPTAITLTGSDPEGSPITFSIVAPPSHGTLSGTAPNVTYAPAANYNGPDSFTFRTNDGSLNSAAATVSITVSAVNDPPVANAQSVTTPEDTAKAITLTGSDVEGGALTYSIVTPPANGVLTGTAPNVTYTPAANYNGADSFTFRVNDGSLNSAPATVSITVTAVNDPPTANAQSVTTPEDTAKAITLTGSDPDGNPLTYSIVSLPANGGLSGTAPNLTYTAGLNFNGADTFTFRVNDGMVNSATATVSITVTAVNDAPVANAQSLSTPEDTAVGITLTGSDLDGDAITYVVMSTPLHGALTGSGASRTYTPVANYNGPDSFTFKVNDGTVDSATVTVSITVTAVNDAPVANAQSVGTPEDTPLAITLTGSDVEGSGLTYTIVSGPTHGTLSGAGASRTYTPALNYNGADSFTFRVNDGSLDSAPATVSITVAPTGDPPTATPQTVSTPEDTPLAVTLSGTDPDGNALTFAVVSPPIHGTLTGTAPSLTYTPAPDYNGPDSFTFRANDGTFDSPAATVSITVTPVNDPPVAVAQGVTTPEDTPLGIVLAASDVEGNALVYSIVTPPTHGMLTGTLPNVTYTPAADYSGPDGFTFKANDGTADSAAAAVSITVTPVNDAPVANAQSVSTPEDTAKGITLSASDVDGDTLTYTVLSTPAHGVLTGAAPSLTYTPNLNYNGTDSFTFKVNDGATDSAPVTVALTVTPLNDPPVANAQTLSSAEDTSVGILLTGSDVDGDALTFIVVSGPAHGTLSGAGASRTYTPTANYTGPDTFTFKVNDGAMDSATATVSITVTPVNDGPTANAQSVTAVEDTLLNILLTGSDPDGDPLTFTLVTGPSSGVLGGVAPNLTYTPNPDFNGSDSFTFRVSDAALSSAPATVSITVTPVNDAPVAKAQSVSLPVNSVRAIVLSGTDVDGDALTFAVSLPPSNGTLSGTAPNLTYTPALNYVGPDSFSFTVNDGALGSQPALVSITVTSDATAPTLSILLPNSGPTFATSSSVIDLSGIASDNVALDRVDWANALTGNSGTASGTSAWAATVMLLPGDNVITVTAFDTTGNSAVQGITVTYTPPPAASSGGGGGKKKKCGATGVEAVAFLGLLLILRRRSS